MNLKVFRRKRIIKSPQEVEDLISLIDKYGLRVVPIGIGAPYKSLEQYKASDEGKEYWRGLSFNIVIHVKDTKLEITTKYGPELLKPCTYIFQLNEEDIFTQSGLETFAQLNKYFHVPKAAEYKYKALDRWYDEETGKYTCSAGPTLGYNKKYENQELTNCYEYDLNSAYFNILLDKVPDLTKPIYNSRVGKNQVGFLLDDKLTLVDFETKATVDVVFNLIETPEGLKEFCKKWYTIKKQASKAGDKELKLKAKAFLNLPIGYCQRYNPFLRSYVVHKCNKVIDSLVEKYKDICLFWNTDAIFTIKPVDELTLGEEIGQWKKIEGKQVRFKGNNYQLDDDIPTVRGVPKAWFKAFEKRTGRPFNLLLDKMPERCNKYTFDFATLTLKEIIW